MSVKYIEDITWPREDTNFIFESRTSERYFQHKEITFISPSGHVTFCLFYRYWWNSYIKHNLFFFNSFSKQQNSAIKVVTYRKLPFTKMLWNSDIKLYRRNKDNNTYLFCSKKSKLMLVTMATPISSHV